MVVANWINYMARDPSPTRSDGFVTGILLLLIMTNVVMILIALQHEDGKKIFWENLQAGSIRDLL